jgi:hypothetical protein
VGCTCCGVMIGCCGCYRARMVASCACMTLQWPQPAMPPQYNRPPPGRCALLSKRRGIRC